MKPAFKIVSFFLFPIIVFLVHVAAKCLGLYEAYPNIDIVSHYMGGLSIAYTATQVLSYLESEKFITVLNRMIFLVLILSVTSMAAVSWEFAEFISDRLLHTNLQPSIANTMQDQFLGMLGGANWVMIQINRSRLDGRKERT